MKPVSLPMVFALLVWMGLVTFVFLLVTVPLQVNPGTILHPLMRLREIIHPLFYSPSILG